MFPDATFLLNWKSRQDYGRCFLREFVGRFGDGPAAEIAQAWRRRGARMASPLPIF